MLGRQTIQTHQPWTRKHFPKRARHARYAAGPRFFDVALMDTSMGARIIPYAKELAKNLGDRMAHRRRGGRMRAGVADEARLFVGRAGNSDHYRGGTSFPMHSDRKPSATGSLDAQR